MFNKCKLNELSWYKFNFQFSGTKIGVIICHFLWLRNFFEKKTKWRFHVFDQKSLILIPKNFRQTMQRPHLVGRNRLGRHLVRSTKTVFVLCSSYKPLPKLLTTKNSKKGGLFAGIYGKHDNGNKSLESFFTIDGCPSSRTVSSTCDGSVYQMSSEGDISVPPLESSPTEIMTLRLSGNRSLQN